MFKTSNLGAARRIERVVAVVEREVITESDLRLEAKVAVALRAGGETADLAPDDELLRTLRDYVIDQTLIDLQAERSGAPAPSPDAIAARIAQLRASFRSRAVYLEFLERHQISEDRVNLICARDIRNDVYLHSRIKTRLTGRTVTAADYQAAVRSWLQELRDTVEVRIVGLDDKLARPITRSPAGALN